MSDATGMQQDWSETLVEPAPPKIWTVTVAGNPHTKGDLRCYGKGGMHRLSEVTTKDKRAWRKLLVLAGRQVLSQIGSPLVGPVSIAVTFTLPRPPSVPLAERAWPVVKYSGDKDKLERMLLDAFGEAGVFGDDAQVVHGVTWKCYPDTPGCADRLDRPGAVIRIWRTDG